jgi:hypothetical protein
MSSNALAIVEKAKNAGALIFTNIENMEAKVELYRTEVTEISFNEKDFHAINGKQMPNKAATDRIGEACGIQFIQAGCRVNAETREDSLCGKRTVYCAEAQGKIRMPDGSWRTSTVDEYEFDPVLRAMLDMKITELNSQTKPVVANKILEYTKVARQRAATGARLRVIRQLTGMPAAFEKAESSKPFVFTRIVQNTDYILKTPEGKAMATAQALGVDMSTLFGGRKLLDKQTNETAQDTSYTEDDYSSMQAEDTTATEEPDFPEEPTGPGSEQETEFQRLTQTLDEFVEGFKDALNVSARNGMNPYNMANDELANTNATVETRSAMISRIRNFLKNKGINV